MLTNEERKTKTAEYIKNQCISLSELKQDLRKDFTPYVSICQDTIAIRRGKAQRLYLELSDTDGERKAVSLLMATGEKNKIYINKKSYDNAVSVYKQDCEALALATDDLVDETLGNQLQELVD